MNARLGHGLAVLLFLAGCGAPSASSASAMTPINTTPPAEMVPAPVLAQPNPASLAPPPPASAPPPTEAKALATSQDGSVELREKPSGGYVLKTREGDMDVPSEWTGPSGSSRPTLSADGKYLGVLRESGAGSPVFEIFDIAAKKSVAKRSPATKIAGGGVEAAFGEAPGSIAWSFTRANCELQDIASGKRKCGSCKNSAYLSLDLTGKKADDPLVVTRNCVK